MKYTILFVSALALSLRAEEENREFLQTVAANVTLLNATFDNETIHNINQENFLTEDYPFTTESITATDYEFSGDKGVEDLTAQSRLIAGIVSGNLESISSALTNGADVNQPDTHGNLPIHIAAYFGNPQVISTLIAAGGDFYTAILGDCNMKKLNQTQQYVKDPPLQLALLHGHTKLAMSLISQGADITIRDSEGLLPIQRALLTVMKKS